MPKPSTARVRRAKRSDLPAIESVEHAAFEPARRASTQSLRRSLDSPAQSVWVIDAAQGVAAFLVLWHSPKAVRVYDVAVHPAQQGNGLGARLMAHTERLARSRGAQRVILEADARQPRLVRFYQQQGYRVVRELPDYYRPGRHALRLEKRLTG